jgi:RIO kinase 1
LKLQKIQNVGLFDRLDGVVQVGKEASVYHAEGSGGEFAVKIYKTTMAEFKDREKYLGGSRSVPGGMPKANTYSILSRRMALSLSGYFQA